MLISAILAVAFSFTSPDCQPLQGHPRLFASDSVFQSMKLKVESGKNPILTEYHANLMHIADSLCSLERAPEYALDASGRRLLNVSRSTLARLFFESYAYRYTRDGRYLATAERDVNAVCDFKDWNPTHYLDCAEMATAVAIAYDWLYHDLQDSTLVKIRQSLKTKAFDTSRDERYTWWYLKDTNWNQVCNAGLVCSVLSVYEDFPDEAERIIAKAIETDRRAAAAIYAPVGAYAEGPVYWNYGTMFQTVLQAALESVLHTDFGLGDTKGLDKTGLFECFMTGATGDFFNYADNLPSRFPCPPLWYLAYRYDNPSLVYEERKFVGRSDIESIRLMPLYIFPMAQIEPTEITPVSDRVYFSPDSQTPVAVVRTGWGSDDLYLGIKGGSENGHHGHMDCGGFVFDAYGVRWACDLPRQKYEELENPCKSLGGEFWDMGQESVRWKLFRFNCRQHNTLTVNGKDHDVTAFVKMVETYDGKGRIGAALDLTPLFNGDLSNARRELSIRDGSRLEVRDLLEAGEGDDAEIRWTLVTRARPEVKRNGIVLCCNGIKMFLHADGADVIYHIWPSGPDGITAGFDNPVPEFVCGFTFTVPAGKKREVVTTLKKL